MAQTTTDPGLAPLKFTGAKYLAQRLVLATLTGRPIRISQIRSSSPTAPGLAPHEVSLLRLLESITNGSHIELSYTGTTVLYRPGLISGSTSGTSTSSVIRHELPAENTRGASYFLIPLCLLAPFSKTQLNILLTGPGVITSSTDTGDLSVDSIRTALLPLFRPFGIDREIELRILRRSSPGREGQGGGGEVQLVFAQQIRLPKTLHLLAPGRIKRIRGVAYATGVAGANNARIIAAARGVLNAFAPDTYVFSDVSGAPLVSVPTKSDPKAKRKTGLGFGLSLVAESSTGVLYPADTSSPPAGAAEPLTPEILGERCALQLLESVATGGCVPAPLAPAVFILMAMGSEDVGRIVVARDVLASEPVVQLARDLRSFGMAGWGMKEARSSSGDEQEDGLVLVSIVGRGVGNVGRKIA